MVWCLVVVLLLPVHVCTCVGAVCTSLGWERKGLTWYLIKKQIKPFDSNPSINTASNLYTRVYLLDFDYSMCMSVGMLDMPLEVSIIHELYQN